MSRPRISQDEAQLIGANLKRFRKLAGLSQKRVARALGVSFQQIQKYERGENRLPLEKLFLLKRFYDIPYAAFFEGLNGEGRSGEQGLGAPIGASVAVYERLMQLKNRRLRRKIERIILIFLEE